MRLWKFLHFLLITMSYKLYPLRFHSVLCDADLFFVHESSYSSGSVSEASCQPDFVPHSFAPSVVELATYWIILLSVGFTCVCWVCTGSFIVKIHCLTSCLARSALCRLRWLRSVSIKNKLGTYSLRNGALSRHNMIRYGRWSQRVTRLRWALWNLGFGPICCFT